VTDPQHGRLPCDTVARDKRLDAGAVGLVEIGRGLIEQQDLGAVGEEAREREALALAGGEACDRPLECVIREAERVEEVGRARRCGPLAGWG